jgi:8-oxo-dGTP pyrophosphatase MutT (NUDIX family)
MSTDDRVARDKARIDDWIRYAAESGETPAIDAATLVALRDSANGVETLMLRRNSKIAFGGMWVFPGGRVDDADRAAAPDALGAARVAAAREAGEEADLQIEAGEMVMFAHWIPPPIAPKRFATWFFAADAGDQDHTIDNGEIVESDWMTPEICLARHHERDIELAPPTWVTLHTMLAQPDVSAALAFLANRPARHHATRIGRSELGPVAMWDGDAGYESTDPALPGPRHRLEMFGEGYHYDDTGLVE